MEGRPRETESLTSAPTRTAPFWSSAVWAACGTGIAAAMFLIWIAAGESFYEGPLYEGPFETSIRVLLASGALYFAAAWLGPGRSKAWHVGWILLIAIAARAPMWLGQPFAGGDYNRYLWDGAATASGVSPYRYSPEEARTGKTDDPAVNTLADDAKDILPRINHPHLRTIYPPAAQAMFAAAHRIAPLDMLGLRIMLALVDAVAAIAVLLLLRAAHLPVSRWAVYLWNPVLIFETYMRCHLDLAVAAAVTLLVLSMSRKHFARAALALAAAIGTKLHPLLLAPLLLRRAWARKRDFTAACVVLSVCCIVMGVLFYPALMGPNSGVKAYADTWRANGWAFVQATEFAEWLMDRGASDLAEHPDALARRITLGVLAVAAIWLAGTKHNNVYTLAGRAAGILLAMLLLSPTLWPWYAVALAPLAAVRPRPSFLLILVLLPLTYVPSEVLDETWRARLIHLPVWLAVAGEGVWQILISPGKDEALA